jgi:uncharacterized protein (DUF1778 family)
MAYSRKRSGSEKRKRAPIIGFRATDEERAKIQAAAQRAGLTVGSYVRSRALSKPTTRAVRRPSVETAQLARLLGLLGIVGGAIQQIAKKQGSATGALFQDLPTALKDFRGAAAAILQTLGKRPRLLQDAPP